MRVNSRTTWHLLICVHCLRVGRLGHVCACVCFGGVSRWVGNSYFSLSEETGRILSTACTIVFNRPRIKQIHIHPKSTHVCVDENGGFLCAQRFDWPGWLDFAVPCELPSNTPPILQRSPTNSLPSGHPDALNHKNRKGLSCKNGVDSIPSGKLKGRDAFLFLSHL